MIMYRKIYIARYVRSNKTKLIIITAAIATRPELTIMHHEIWHQINNDVTIATPRDRSSHFNNVQTFTTRSENSHTGYHGGNRKKTATCHHAWRDLAPD